MTDPLLPLVDDRTTLLRQIAELGDFQPGSITSATRRCGSPACHCAKPNDPGHGPHFQLTQKVDGKTVTQNLPSLASVRKAESEIAGFRRFQRSTGEWRNSSMGFTTNRSTSSIASVLCSAFSRVGSSLP